MSKDIPQAPEQGRRAFEGSRNMILSAAQTDLIPGFARDIILPILRERTFLLSDDQFEKRVVERTDDNTLREHLLSGEEREILARRDGMYLLPTNGKPGEILIRSRYAASEGGRYFLPHLLAEEAGHSVQRETRLPLSNVNPGSALLLPYVDAQEMLRHSRVGDPQRASGEDLVASSTLVTHGFLSIVENDGIPIAHGTDVYEELRAATIEAVLLAIMYGQKMIPDTSGTQEQFVAGLDNLRAFVAHYPRESAHEAAGITMIESFVDLGGTKKQEMKKSLHSLVSALYYKRLDTFLGSLNTYQKQAFDQAFEMLFQSYAT